ncbi:hypothetical protein [Granulicella tundricola]|uniref:Uncharacterized protein n=1 Tax=Granulicella tundricola (strain ATCC BAA-1859 / DSM 23138 / MP5ACTX9) TaxID=1198114 RepID=E8X4Z0_GRATM|nr:hypothetical protein [Granulicella tundricola]ADW67182.1 hypothetical protein AciX9_0093 [Granulicella tundricola MP5ACTX9]
MTLVQLVELIGNVLTQLDRILSDPALPSSNPDWQQLYAMRVQLDGKQKQLVGLSITLDDNSFTSLTSKIADADATLKQQIGDLAKVASTISTAAKIAALADQIISLAAAL